MRDYRAFVLRLHGDQRGDLAQTVLLIALIAIPLVVLLIAFGTEIAGWLKDKWNDLTGHIDDIPTTK